MEERVQHCDPHAYAATCVFPFGGEEKVQLGWPATADKLSILLQEIERVAGQERRYEVGFLAPDLARRFVHSGAGLLITEGLRWWPQGRSRESSTPERVRSG